jgi:hypothetical protein
MRLKIHQDLTARDRAMANEAAKRRAELGLSEESGGVLGSIIVFVVLAVIAAAVVVGAIVLIRYGYARHWWW